MNEIISEEKVTAFNKVMTDKGLTILCAESITAGLLASTIASIPGASGILRGSVVTYQESFKKDILGVDPGILAAHSAESIETTFAMVEGLKRIDTEERKKRMDADKDKPADIYVAVTGLASYYKDHPNKKVWGDICVVIDYMGKSTPYEYNITPPATGTDYTKRNFIREKAVEYILDRILEIVNAP